MCVICDCQGDWTLLEGLETLRCERCPDITHIPPIPSLRHLSCENCPRLATLPPRLDSLVGLYVAFCPITVIPDYPRLKLVNVCEYRSAIEIRSRSIRELHYDGGFLSDFPEVLDLQILLLYHTTFATIPLLPKLEFMRIEQCSGVFPILPIFPALRDLQIHYCAFLLSVPRLPALESLVLDHGEFPFAYVPRGIRKICTRPTNNKFMVGSKVRAWSWRSKQRIASRLELRRVLAALRLGGTAAFVGPVIDIVARLI